MHWSIHEREVGGHDQRCAFVASREGLEHQLCRAVRKGQIASSSRTTSSARAYRPTTLASSRLPRASWSSFARAARVVNRTRRPCWQAQTPRGAVASIVLPVPGQNWLHFVRSAAEDPAVIERGSEAVRKWFRSGVVRADQARSRRAVVAGVGGEASCALADGQAGVGVSCPAGEAAAESRPAPRLGAYRELIDEWLIANLRSTHQRQS
jgi:hypothetical protein